ncbi:DgyrCDS14312, partial [Dimorphilus gyrociliatus]
MFLSFSIMDSFTLEVIVCLYICQNMALFKSLDSLPRKLIRTLACFASPLTLLRFPNFFGGKDIEEIWWGHIRLLDFYEGDDVIPFLKRKVHIGIFGSSHVFSSEIVKLFQRLRIFRARGYITDKTFESFTLECLYVKMGGTRYGRIVRPPCFHTYTEYMFRNTKYLTLTYGVYKWLCLPKNVHLLRALRYNLEQVSFMINFQSVKILKCYNEFTKKVLNNPKGLPVCQLPESHNTSSPAYQ